MALFVTKEGQRKSPIAITCFFVSILFCGVYALGYALLTEPLYRYLYIGNDALSSGLHCTLIALVGTAICCTLFMLKDKRIVPYSFVGLAIIVLMACIATFQLEQELQKAAMYVISIYLFSPVLIGNLVSWTIYCRLRKLR